MDSEKINTPLKTCEKTQQYYKTDDHKGCLYEASGSLVCKAPTQKSKQ